MKEEIMQWWKSVHLNAARRKYFFLAPSFEIVIVGFIVRMQTRRQKERKSSGKHPLPTGQSAQEF